MDFDAMDKNELLKQVKRLAGGGLGGARAYNELNQMDERDPDEIKDGYQLRFIGKDYARLQASQQTETVLVPNVAHNQVEANKDSQNIFITGDNLDALKHLENSYSGKVDVIYIDPPYNTGSDGFVYADNFRYSDEELKLKLGLTDSEVERIRNLEGKSSHSAWLTFMYPRLRIAKRLLSDKGVIFISIDDNEQANLKVLCDEIFAESNFVTQLTWQKIHSTKNDAKYFSVNHEYITCYSRNINNVTINLLERTEEMNARYQNPDNDPRGPWQSGDLVANEFRKDGNYEVLSPKGIAFNVPMDKHWVYSQERMKALIAENSIWFGKDGDAFPRKKRFLSEVQQGKRADTLLLSKVVGNNQEGKRELLGIFEGIALFETPKPAKLMKHLLGLASDKNAVILDFFAGSATTGDAVMQLNAEDGGNRKYILVQLDEEVASGSEAEKQGYKTIDQISRKRLEKASAKIRADKGDKLPAGFDSGFKHYTLATTSETTLDKLDAFDPGVLLPDDMSAVFDGESLGIEGGASGDETLLTTWLIDDGFGLNADTEMLEFADAKAYKAENRLYILDNSWSKGSTAELLNAIGKDELPITSVVVYAYALNFETMRELKVNLKTNLDQTIEIIERF